MKTTLIDLAEMSESQEIMLKKSPRYMLVFIYSTLAIIAVALVWCWFSKIDTKITTTGEITGDQAAYKAMLYVPASEVLQVHAGLDVECVLEHTEMKSKGKVLSVLDDIIVDAQTAQTYYKVEVSIADDQLKNQAGENLKIKPAMIIRANIITGTKRVWGIL